MKSILEQINKTPGVIGSALFEKGGRCLADAFSPPYSAILWTEVIKDLQQIAVGFTAIDAGPIEATVAMFEQGTVVARQTNGLVLCVLAAPDANLAMLGVGLKVGILQLRSNPNPSATSGAPVSSRVSTQDLRVEEQVSRRPSPVANSSVLASSREIGTSVESTSSSSDSLGWGRKDDWARRQGANAAGRSAMHHLLRTFARYAGPQAKFILEDEIERLGWSPMTLPGEMLGELIEAAALRIPSKANRKKFVAEALGDG